MSNITYIPNYADQAVALLPSPYHGAERIEALTRAAAAAPQVIEDATFDAMVGDNPTDAAGVTLDRWGRIVGQPRRGLTDEEYRRFIEARIQANIAGSSIEELIELWEAVTAPGEIRHFQLSPAAYALVVFRNTPMRPTLRARVRELMKAVQPAGIGMTLIEAPATDAAYQYDEGPGLNVGAFARIL